MNPESFKEATESSITFRAHIHANQLHVNDRSIRQYSKQQSVQVFPIKAKVSVTVSALDRTSTNDKPVFGQVIKNFGDNYSIQTKYEVLDRYFPISELMLFPDTIELDILEPLPNKEITLYTVAAKENINEKVPLYYKCKNEGNGVLHIVAHMLKPK